MFIIIVLVGLVLTFGFIKDLAIIIGKLLKGKKGMQEQRALFVRKIIEAVAEKHEPTKAMLSLVSVNGFQNKKDKCMFKISPLPGKKKELAELMSLGKNFSLNSTLKWKNIFNLTCSESMSMLFTDGLLWGFYCGHMDDDEIDNFAMRIRKKSKLEWVGDFSEASAEKEEPPLCESRKAFLSDFIKRLEKADGKLPLLTLNEFFDGNQQEDSIAPNQWDDNRPTLAQMRERFREIEKRPDVAWVRVQLHDDTAADEYSCEILGDSIVICTTADAGDLEDAADTEGLGSDGVIKVYSLDEYNDVPAIPKGYCVWAIVWD